MTTRTLVPLSMTCISATQVATAQPATSDTIHLEVGSPEIDGRVFPSHSARNRTYVGEGGPPISTWMNDLTVASREWRSTDRVSLRADPASAGI